MTPQEIEQEYIELLRELSANGSEAAENLLREMGVTDND